MVVDGNRQDLLGVILADHKVIEGSLDRGGFYEPESGFNGSSGGMLIQLSINDRLAHVNAGIADLYTRAGDNFPHLRL